MASHANQHEPDGSNDSIELGGKSRGLAIGALIVGVVAILACLGLSASSAGLGRFYHAYLTSYAFFFSIAMGGLFFLLIHYLVRAGWSTSVRRIPEALASTLPIMGLLAIPMIVAAWSGKGTLYPWAQPITEEMRHHPGPSQPHIIEELTEPHAAPHGETASAAGSAASHGSTPAHATPAADAHGTNAVTAAKPVSGLTMGKLVWLNPKFWTARVVFYFVFLSLLAWYFINKSRGQDKTGDHAVNAHLNLVAAPMMLLTFTVFSFAAFDLIMSLDSEWYSTVFGIYYFAGGIDAMVASVIIIAALLQRAGYLQNSITKEHYHDLGKYLFAFTFFWGYIAFSQFMLYWYANIPETTYWFAKRGATTNPEQLKLVGGWAVFSMVLLFGRLLIPFAGLLSRHVKRNMASLVFWAIWILVFHFVDMVWIVMPEYAINLKDHPGRFTFGLPEVAALVGIGGIFIGAVVWRLSAAPLRPVRDPRLNEALVFQNI